MAIGVCTAQDIFNLNQTKEYILTASHILQNVLTDENLNPQSTKLWQILFSKARFNPNLETKVSYAELAELLNRSTRSISRYIENLTKAGYLIIKHNFDSKGSQCPSTISIRVPTYVIETAKNIKNRNTIKDYISYEAQSNDVSCVKDVPNKYLETSFCEKSDKSTLNNPIEASLENHDIFVIGEGDKYVKQKNNIKINNNKTNNNEQSNLQEHSLEKHNSYKTVVVNELTKKIKHLECLLHIEKEKESFLNLKNCSSEIMYEQTRKINFLETSLEVLSNKLKLFEKDNKTCLSEESNYYKLAKDDTVFNTKPGDRKLPIYAFKRLKKSLQLYGYQENKLNFLINEIIFEIRFGSLVMSKKNTHLTIDNAINIALKLVREERWETPALFNEFINNHNS
jgi:hypothetical protein